MLPDYWDLFLENSRSPEVLLISRGGGGGGRLAGVNVFTTGGEVKL